MLFIKNTQQEKNITPNEPTDYETIYRVGYTNDNRIILSLGHSSTMDLVMSPSGVRNLINLLETAISTYEEDIDE